MSSSPFGENYAYFKGLGQARTSAVLPPQAIPKSKKNDKWEQSCLDNLEAEGLRQYYKNLEFSDYYRMISGEMSYVDLVEEDQDVLFGYIQKTKQELNLPSYLRHFDLMYPIVSKIVGEWMLQPDKFRFDTTDDVSTNDYIREETARLTKFAEASFKATMNKLMLLKGIDPQTDFKSEEDYQQYQQQLQQIQQEYYPDQIEKSMKNWKTECAQYAQKVWERDSERFKMSKLEELEARDILLTGKSVRHYRIGYDYYYPEYWHPIQTFHSKESSVTRIEDCEFAGRIEFYTLTQVMTNYGHILNEKQREQIYKSYFGEEYRDYTNFTNSGTSRENSTALLGEGYFDRMITPFQGYYDHKLALEFESVTGIPQSQITDIRSGTTRDIFSTPLDNQFANHTASIAQNLRTDIDIRLDTIQTTEAYWRGFKKLGVLTTRSENGYLFTIEVDEDLLPEVKKEYNLKNLKNISLEEFKNLKDDKKENTIVWVDIPTIYKGVKFKVGATGLYLESDIYHVEELKYKIKGEKGNIFDLKLPVCGHIGDSFAKKIRPEQITYNYLLNQNQSYLEKEIGAFFVVDINAIPTEYFNLGAGEDTLIDLRNLAKTTGLLPTDLGRNSLNQNGSGTLMFNPMTYQNATFTDQLTRNLQMAENYKWQAYSKFGITPQAMGSPSQYSTAEGIQVGQQAVYAQTYNIESIFLENKRSNIEVHMAVAQYCQTNNLDANYIYMASNNEVEFLQSIKDDENFALRKIDVRPIFNAKKAREFQQLKQMLIQNNTMGNDAMALTQLILSDDFMELKEAAQNARLYLQKIKQQQQEHEQNMVDSQNQAKLKIHTDEIQIANRKIDASVQIAATQAKGRIGDNLNDPSVYDLLQQDSDNFLKNKELDGKQILEYNKLLANVQQAAKKVDIKAQELALEKERIQVDRERINAMKYVADARNRDSIINPQ